MNNVNEVVEVLMQQYSDDYGTYFVRISGVNRDTDEKIRIKIQKALEKEFKQGA